MVASNQAINHYFYMAFHPHPDAAVVEDRMSRYLDTIDEKVPLVGKRWTNEWLPLIRIATKQSATPTTRIEHAELLAKFDDMTDWMTEMWYIHGHINFVGLGRKAQRPLHRCDAPDDPTEAYQILQGYHTVRSTPRTACGGSVASFATVPRCTSCSTTTTPATSPPSWPRPTRDVRSSTS